MRYLLIICIFLSCFSCKNKSAPTASIVKPISVNDETFTQFVLENEQLVVVDFWADWCGPCKQFEPSFNQLANDFANEVQFAKLDYDRNQLTAYQYNVTGLPSILFFKHGKVVHRQTGLTTREHLRGKIQQFK